MGDREPVQECCRCDGGQRKDRFDVTDLSDFEKVIQGICTRRALLNDYERAYSLLLKEFKDGKLGRISLEKVQ